MGSYNSRIQMHYRDKTSWVRDLMYYNHLNVYVINAGIDDIGYWIRVERRRAI